MRQNAPNIAAFVVLAAAATGLWWYADRNWIPKPEPAAKTEVPQPASADAVAAAAGGAVAHAPPKLAPPAPKVEPKAPAAPTEPPTLITLGGDGFNNRVTLTTQGAGVQQVILPAFDEADRIGHEVKEDGKPVPLHLIPGEKRVRGEKLKEDFVVPHLPPGKVNDPALRGRLAEPAYTLFHYASPDDKHPDPHLGTVNWRVVEESRPADGPHTVAFEAVLGEPFFVKVRKSYTLAPKDYHIGLRLEFSRTDTGGKAARPFRYQLSGPRGLPVEGEWYTSTTRTALVGYDNRNRPRRQYEDAASINTKRGGEALHAGNGENQFRYIAIATPYFASALAVDRSADPKANPWAYVRATSELPFLPPPEERAK
ncbi:MAG TPA: hypothetical protein VD866_29445, partial [Urbifossiella sp.]|nr:hypothetical protein [Urbifossiella sp.]